MRQTILNVVRHRRSATHNMPRRGRIRGGRLIRLATLLALIPAGAVGRVREAAGPESIPGGLQAVIDAAGDGDTISVGPGCFLARPEPFFDPLCGNCEVHGTEVRASTGYRIVGKRLVLIGAGAEKTALVTRAGYGIYIEDASGTVIRDLAVTGGRRDTDGNATDAAIVVRRASVRLENLQLRDNTDRAPGVIVGIGGVMGREGSEIQLSGCRIANNGWDGIALYRGSMAVITDNVIERGRGAGIGITWDAAATILRNRVSGYWKGIGTFGSSRAVVRNNAVFDNLGWGIIATGESFLEAAHNVIVRNGNCGFAVWSAQATGLAVNNLIIGNGWRVEWVCPRVGVWHAGSGERFTVHFNDAHGNVQGAWRSEAAEPPPTTLSDFDPLFRGPEDFRLRPHSPAIDAGDTTRSDADGTRSDLGLSGGPAAIEGLGAVPPRLQSERERVGSAKWERARWARTPLPEAAARR